MKKIKENNKILIEEKIIIQEILNNILEKGYKMREK